MKMNNFENLTLASVCYTLKRVFVDYDEEEDF